MEQDQDVSKRATGRTTRQTDAYIQLLFDEYNDNRENTTPIEVKDHWGTREATEELLRNIGRRLQIEHRLFLHIFRTEDFSSATTQDTFMFFAKIVTRKYIEDLKKSSTPAKDLFNGEADFDIDGLVGSKPVKKLSDLSDEAKHYLDKLRGEEIHKLREQNLELERQLKRAQPQQKSMMLRREDLSVVPPVKMQQRPPRFPK